MISDGQGDGRILDHPGSGFAARNERRRGSSYPSALTSTGTFMDIQSKEEVDIQGAKRVAFGPVEGTFKSGSTGTTTKGSATCPWTGFSTVGKQPEEGQEWVEKPFVAVLRSIRQARMQYESMEEALEQIGSEFGMRPNGIIPTIWSLPKVWEMEELRARIAGLLKENADVKAQVADRDRKLKEAEA